MIRLSTHLAKELIPLAFPSPTTPLSAEELFARKFLSQLPRTEYAILNNILLTHSEGTAQIDNIVVSRFGIFVIEAKARMGSWIRTHVANILRVYGGTKVF